MRQSSCNGAMAIQRSLSCMSRILKDGYVPLGSAEPGSDPGRRAWIKIIFNEDYMAGAAVPAGAA
jgi:hypothetical protein